MLTVIELHLGVIYMRTLIGKANRKLFLLFYSQKVREVCLVVNGGGLSVWEGVSTQHCTLSERFCDSPSYLSNIINHNIMPLHEQHRTHFYLRGRQCFRLSRGNSEGVARTVSRSKCPRKCLGSLRKCRIQCLKRHKLPCEQQEKVTVKL